jgi:hypothetical protein
VTRSSQSVRPARLLPRALLLGLVAACAPTAPTIAPALTPPQTPLSVPTSVSENVVPPSPCPTTSLEAEAVQDARWVVAVRDGDGRIHKVIWPSGFWARYERSWVSLYDAGGFEVAKTNRGDWLRIPGVPLDPDVWLTCGTIERVTRSGSPSSATKPRLDSPEPTTAR